MAFVNEYVAEKDSRTFVTAYGRKLTPGKWTIDKEKDVILFWRKKDQEPPHDEDFIFYYRGYVIDLTMHQIVIDPNIVKWRVLSINIPKELEYGEVMLELKEAFVVYGYNGSPFWNNEDYIVELEGREK
jgi:hypothetical protein